MTQGRKRHARAVIRSVMSSTEFPVCLSETGGGAAVEAERRISISALLREFTIAAASCPFLPFPSRPARWRECGDTVEKLVGEMRIAVFDGVQDGFICLSSPRAFPFSRRRAGGGRTGRLISLMAKVELVAGAR